MSGFEALGLACTVFQTISFAHETAAICMEIYRGQKTPDLMLEENAAAMIDAAKQTKGSCHLMTTPEQKCLAEIAEKCIDTAQQLELEVQKITKRYKRRDLIAAFRAHLRSTWKKRKIDELQDALDHYRDTMQTLLVTKICNENEANSLKLQSGFCNLKQDLQVFISQIAAGCTKMEDLLRREAILTRDHITAEANLTGRSLQACIVSQSRKAATEAERRHFLQSLKFDEMNQRRNNITDPRDVIFARIFRSYDNTGNINGDINLGMGDNPANSTTEIDMVWQGFTDWLRSNESLFWMQGKPGSGKSTLVQYVIKNKVTQALLGQWNSNTKILSHFFWKIGTPLQSNIKGFYFSLIYQLLSENEGLLDTVITKSLLTTPKTHHHDWAEVELEFVLDTALNDGANMQPLCIFIDGLDEYTGDDGQEGLVKRIKRLGNYDKVKLCVSSRPEPRINERLIYLPHLQLHALTRPDMAAYIEKEISRFISDQQDTAEILDEMTETLLQKAQGVFLWLQLAVKSLKSGFQNCDSHSLLILRLNELPDTLESLYSDMWKRMNQDSPIYREFASQYFKIVIHDSYFPFLLYHRVGLAGLLRSEISGITLFQILCATDPEIQRRFLSTSSFTDFDDVAARCARVEKYISTRCAGLLEIRPHTESALTNAACLNYVKSKKLMLSQHSLSKVNFIHRTAHDFLVDTEVGRQILGHGKLSLLDEMKGFLCRVQYDADVFDACYNLTNILRRLVDMSKGKDEDGDGAASSWMFELLPHAQDLSGKRDMDTGGLYIPRRHFLSFAARFTELDGFVGKALEEADATTATRILSDVVLWRPSAPSATRILSDVVLWGPPAPSADVVRKLVSRGGDPLAIAEHIASGKKADYHTVDIAYRTMALWGLLETFYKTSAPDPKASYYAEVAEVMIAEQCATSDCWGLVGPARLTPEGRCEAHWNLSLAEALCCRFHMRNHCITPLMEVNVDFLLRHVLDQLSTSEVAELGPKLHPRIANPVAYLRFLILCHDDKSKITCFRVINQEPLQDIISLLYNNMGGIRSGRFNNSFQEWYHTAMDLIEDQNVLEPIELEDVLAAPAVGGRLGPCRLNDAGFAWSNDKGDYIRIRD